MHESVRPDYSKASSHRIHYITSEHLQLEWNQKIEEFWLSLHLHFEYYKSIGMDDNAVSQISNITSSGIIEEVRWRVSLPLIVAVPLITLVVMCSIATFAGNLLVFFAFIVEKRLQSNNNYFLLSLAIADGIIGLISVNMWLILYLSNGVWPFGWNLCVIWILLDYVCCTTSIYHVFIISIDRYWSVAFPANYRMKMSPRIAGYMVIPTWLIPLVWWLALIVGHPLIYGVLVPNGYCWANYWGMGLLTYLSTSITYWIPVIIITALYLHIYRVAKKIKQRRNQKAKQIKRLTPSIDTKPQQQKSLRTITSPTNSVFTEDIQRKNAVDTNADSGIEDTGSNENNQSKNTSSSEKRVIDHNGIVLRNTFHKFLPNRKQQTNETIIEGTSLRKRSRSSKSNNDRKAMRTLTFLLGAFILCWTPWNICEVINGIRGQNTVNHHIYQFTWLLTYINSSLNPICYAFANTLFKDTFIRILTCRIKQKNRRQVRRR